eukprot:gene11080-19674_t
MAELGKPVVSEETRAAPIAPVCAFKKRGKVAQKARAVKRESSGSEDSGDDGKSKVNRTKFDHVKSQTTQKG